MSRVLTADPIFKVSHYYFDKDKMMLVQKHAKLPNNENKRKGIIGLDSTVNPFIVNLFPIQDMRKIGSVALVQARSKIR